MRLHFVRSAHKKKKCPECGAYLLLKSGKNGKYYKCSSKTCKYKRDHEDNAK